MNNLDIIKAGIDANTELNEVQKNMIKGSTERALEYFMQHKTLIYDIKNAMYKGDRYLIDEFFEMDKQYVIFKATSRSENESFYRTFDRETKKLLSEVSYTVHGQILVTLGVHYEGGNSRFAGYAEKMLGIENNI